MATPDYLLSVRMGNVAGAKFHTVLGYNRNAGVLLDQTIWPAMNIGRVSKLSAASTSLKLVSTSANDAIAGIGAQKVRIDYLDGNYAEQNVTLDMNGTTNVDITNSVLRINSMRVIQAGSRNYNEGDICIENAAGDECYYHMAHDTNNAQTALFTVPDGKTAYLLNLFMSSEYHKTAEIKGEQHTPGFAPLVGGQIDIFENSANLPIYAYPGLPEHTDFEFICKSSVKKNGDINVYAEFLLVDNV
jgi:hypothetical protein